MRMCVVMEENVKKRNSKVEQLARLPDPSLVHWEVQLDGVEIIKGGGQPKGWKKEMRGPRNYQHQEEIDEENGIYGQGPEGNW